MSVDARNLTTVRQFGEQRPVFSEPAIRWFIFNSQKNGLAAAGAIVRVPGSRRVLIDVTKFDQWLASGESK